MTAYRTGGVQKREGEGKAGGNPKSEITKIKML